jgi:fumarate reductase subunit D
MDEQQKLMNWILKIAVGSLASIMIAVVIILLVGLFLPNTQIDNNEIFKILGPAFNTVIGAFVGLLGGLSLNNRKPPTNDKPQDTPPADKPTDTKK